MAFASDDAGSDAVGDDEALIESRAKYGSRVIANGVEGNCLATPWSPPADARRGRLDADRFQAAAPALRCLPPTSSRLLRAVTAGSGEPDKGIQRGAGRALELESDLYRNAYAGK